MKKVYYTPCLLIVLLCGVMTSKTSAQCLPSSSQVLETNEVRTRIHNGGDQWWNLVDSSRYEVPVVPPGVQPLHCGFAASMWIGGLDDSGNIHVAGNTYRQNGMDYYTGPVRVGMGYDCGTEVAAPKLFYRRGFTLLAGGQEVLPYTGGFMIFDEGTGSSTDAPFPNLYPESACLQLQDGRVIAIADLTSMPQDVVMIMDTLSFTPAVACTLAANHSRPCLTLLSTGEVLISSVVTEVFNPATLTATAVPGSVSCSGAKSILYPSDSVLLFGGFLGSGSQWYAHATGSFSTGPSLNQSYSDIAIGILPGGNYIVAGKSDNKHTEIYNPVTRTFSWGPDLAEQLGVPVAEALPSGDVVFSSNETMQLYHAATDSFSCAGFWDLWGGMGILPSGKVLVQTWDTLCHVYDPYTGFMDGNAYQHLWNLTSTQISDFLADYAAGTVDYTRYRDVESWPAHGNTAMGESEHLAPFVDADFNGIYDPATGDYPCITGDQTLWYLFNDDGPHKETGSDFPMQVETEYTAYGFSSGSTTCIDSFVDYSTFYHYEITNRSGEDYHDVYVGLIADADLGNWMDDLIGCDTLRNLGFIFNGDAYDEGYNGYGLNPPAFGVTLLSTPGSLGLTNFMTYRNDFTVTGNPQEATDYYGLLKSDFKDSSHVVNNGADGYPGTAPGPLTNYMFPGNAGWCGGSASGWNQIDAAITPGDARIILSCGPFDLPADTTVKLDYVAIWARTVSGGNLASVCELQQASDAITNWWHGLDLDCFGLMVQTEQAQAAQPLMEVFPNPSAGRITVRLAETPERDTEVHVLDMTGRCVHTQHLATGMKECALDCTDLSGGLYQVSCEVNGKVLVKKVILE